MEQRPIVLPFLLLAVGAAAAGSCIFPDFSHKNALIMSWLADRSMFQSHKQQESQRSWNWVKYGKTRTETDFGSANATNAAFKEFLDWVHVRNRVESRRKFFLIHNKRPRFKSGSAPIMRNHGQSAVAAADLREGDSVLEVPLHYCMLDNLSNEDPVSLKALPWELRLATKLLRERSKGKLSFWAPFIKLLPSSIASPLFFSNQELKSIEDASIMNEITSIRNFVEVAFQSLQGHETAGASFEEFAWALAVVYTLSCKLDDGDQTGLMNRESTHVLIPFYSASYDSPAQVSVHYDGKLLKLLVDEGVAQGSFLRLKTDEKSSSHAFIYHGFVPRDLLCDRTRVFEDLQDLVNWYFSTYGGVNRNKYLTFKLAKHALQALDSVYRQSNAALFVNSIKIPNSLPADYSVGSDGYTDPHIMCVLAILSIVNDSSILKDRSYASNYLIDFVPNDETTWNKWLHIIACECLCLNCSTLSGCSKGVYISDYIMKPAFASSLSALQSRLALLLDSFSTILVEDKALLDAVAWEGFSGSRLCPSCKWHTEELTVNDELVVQLHSVRKDLLTKILLKLSYDYPSNRALFSDMNHEPVDLGHESTSAKELLKWCEEQGSMLSEKISITNFCGGEDPASLISGSSCIRGVQALQDIEQGETISVLPLDMGLFNNESIDNCGADSWHLAAARLLQEKALGIESQWATYIASLPQGMPTPINLDPYELTEVQWWPMLREVIQVRKAIKESYNALFGPQLAWADFKEYRWAATMVHSRAFTLPMMNDEQYACYVLMPFMDLINHHYHYQADWMSIPVREGKLEIIAKQPIYKGKQLFASFGPRSNDNLFLYYGFVLDDNPFDSAQIFASFEEGVQWFMNLLRPNCKGHTPGTATAVLCKLQNWEQIWYQADAIDEQAVGISAQRTEWWELVNKWAENGYEYMPFQSTPSIYAGGVVNPSLLTALEDIAKKTYYSNSTFYTIEFCNNTACKSNPFSNSTLKDFFDCMDKQEWPTSTYVLYDLICWKHLVSFLVTKVEQTHAMLFAKIAVALRCLEILKSFPTNIHFDKFLLDDHKESHNMFHSESLRPSPHLHLTRQYRYLKKLLLRDHINKLVNSFDSL